MTFDNHTIEKISGYKISVGFQPRTGFAGAFYIYVEQEIWSGSENKLESFVLGPRDKYKKKTLKLNNHEVDYQFHNIDLVGISTEIDQRTRKRILTFQYTGNVTDRVGDPKPSIVLKNMGTDKVDGSLDDMELKISDGAEELLSFHSYQRPNSGPIFRFSNRKNKENSWLKKIIESSVSRLNDNGNFPPFQVTFTPKDISVNSNAVTGILIDESYGTMLGRELLSLDELARRGTLNYLELSKIRPTSITPKQLAERNLNSGNESPALAHMSVETATLFFDVNQHSDIDVV